MNKNLRLRYKNKKENAKKRGIPFSLTVEEYSYLVNLPNCTYTGVKFDENNPRSIERILDGEGYHFWNCTAATVKANKLKTSIVTGQISKLEEDRKLTDKVLNSYETQKRKVLKFLNNQEQEVCCMMKDEESQNIDVQVAQEYIKFNQAEKDSSISFNVYKKKYLRRSCEISGKLFTSTGGSYLKRTITKIDHSKPFTDDNIRVVCNVFANIHKNKLFTKKEMIKAVSSL